ncbi:MAG: hypothetical protein NT061_08830 [Spirochaetes bacterium]|nr:hypothetical protein [Spirochaetota bacterium]
MEDSPPCGMDKAASFRGILDMELRNQGFFSWGFLDKEAFKAVIDDSQAKPAAFARYGIDETESVVVVALRYGEGEFDPPAWAASRASESSEAVFVEIARFARANWYGEILARLKAAVEGLIDAASGMGFALPPSRRWKRLVNSALPERDLALGAGLGAQGKNGLVIADRRGKGDVKSSSAVLLGLLLCPAGLGRAPKAVPAHVAPCGSCRSCLDVCPTKALGGEEMAFCRELCLQNWTARDLDPPLAVEESMGSILYGCDACLGACPYFRTDPGARTELGILGPRLPVDFFMDAADSDIKKRLSGTALGLSWMSVKGFRRCAVRASRLGQAPT